MNNNPDLKVGYDSRLVRPEIKHLRDGSCSADHCHRDSLRFLNYDGSQAGDRAYVRREAQMEQRRARACHAFFKSYHDNDRSLTSNQKAHLAFTTAEDENYLLALQELLEQTDRDERASQKKGYCSIS